MKATRRIVGSLLCVVAVMTPLAAASPQNETACQGRLDGEQFPFLVPEYLVWEDTFSRAEGAPAAGTGPQLTDAGRRSLQATGSAALKRAAALRAAPFEPSGVSPATAAADLLLEARDDLLRALSSDDANRLMEHMESARRDTRYTFSKRGRRVGNPNANVTCLVTIHGKEQPELTPEPYYWEFYFRVLASISEQRRTRDGGYAADYMAALRGHHLPIPEQEVIAVLARAQETIPRVDAMRAKYQDSRDAERAVATIVRAARLRLLRSLPRESWTIVQRDAASRRLGVEYDFPTSY